MNVTLDSLNLTAGGPGRSRRIQASIVRNLKQEDVMALALTPAPASEQNFEIARIRTIHHHCARALAAGMSNVQVSAMTGLSPTTIGRYQKDPSFQELLRHYGEREDELFQSLREKMAKLSATAAEALMERILADPDLLATKDLIDLMNSTMDRSGERPAEKPQKVEHRHLHFSADAVQEMKNAAKEGRKGQVLARTIELPPETGRGAAVGGEIIDGAVLRRQAEPIPREQS